MLLLKEMRIPVYLDNNATTPCDPRVVETMLPFFTQHFGNAASRNHQYGWQAEEAVDFAREQAAKLIGAGTKELVFTSGSTEGVNLAIKGVFEMYAVKGNHIITVSTEHKAVLDTCANLEKRGASLTYLSVNQEGLINLSELEAAIRPETILIAIMYANNETGTIQPIREIGRIAKKHGVIFFSDATQAVGKIPVNVIDDGIDLLCFSSHKFYGPKGIGALYIRRKDPRVRLVPQMDGGGHERGMRSGTLNVPAIAGFGKACEIALEELSLEARRLANLRDLLETGLLELPGTAVNGSKSSRLPQVTNISFKNAESEALLLAINKDVAVSSGSACTSASIEPSYVLKALGLTDAQAHSSLRFGVGRFTTREEVDFTIEKIKVAVTGMRALNPA
ncbi:IscS subfamily cysteine desulfurase [Flavitalea sp.]|nr:IscS subfamily cysteine desulfurase [Flavitalea sp.]